MSGCSGGNLKTAVYKFPEIIFRLEAFICNHEAIKKCNNDHELFMAMGVLYRGNRYRSGKERYYLTNGLCLLIFSTAMADMRDSPNMSSVSLEATKRLEELETLKEKFFKSWAKYSGNFAYPVDDSTEYDSIKNVADNPKRLELAEHLLSEFKKVTV